MQERKRVIALGFFDGVHMAHGALLSRVAEVAAALDAIPAALTFDRLPKHRADTLLLSTAADRQWLMERYYGIREVEVLTFDRAMMEMPWQQFVTGLLARDFNAIHVVAGHDFHFGYRGEGDPEKLRALCGELGIGCDIIGRIELDGVTISSTHIRGLLQQGEMEEACRYLGHPHILSGQVAHGKGLGRTLGFPTANLIPPAGVLVPAFGVYATRVVTEEGDSYLAVTNVGNRPTVDDGDKVTIEPWILDFDGDLYGRTIRVEFYKKLRGERKFTSLEELRAEIFRNADQTRAYFAEKN